MAPRDVATDCLRLASSGHAREAWQRYGADDLVHHNPSVPGDVESLIAAMDARACVRLDPTAGSLPAPLIG
jgi:hypothetical protein